MRPVQVAFTTALLATLLTACGAATSDAVCQARITYRGTTYLGYDAGQEVATEKSLGDGRQLGCADGGDRSRAVQVRKLPGVDASQAVSIATEADILYVATTTTIDELPSSLRDLFPTGGEPTVGSGR